SDEYLIEGVKYDNYGHLYISGNTSSQNGIGKNGIQSSYGGGKYDGFLANFDTSGALNWSTYYGGTEEERLWQLELDKNLAIYICGFTYSKNAISQNGFQNALSGNQDAFLVKYTDHYLGFGDFDKANCLGSYWTFRYSKHVDM